MVVIANEVLFENAAALIDQADGLLITAGAGIGVDSGLPDFRGTEGFWKAYPALAKAGIHFQQFSMSIRKQFLSWIDSAKKPETRNARLEQTVRMAEANRKPGLKGFQL